MLCSYRNTEIRLSVVNYLKLYLYLSSKALQKGICTVKICIFCIFNTTIFVNYICLLMTLCSGIYLDSNLNYHR